MARKYKKSFNIGDTFLSWEVISCVNPKTYRYLCRCICGNERDFNKYNLLRGSYAPCKECSHSEIENLSLIKKHWNCELNGSIFTRAQDFSLTKSYWFICNNGHNFKSSLKDFSLDKCLSCKCKIKEDTARIKIVEFSHQLFNSFCDDVEVAEEALIIRDYNIIFVFNETDRFSNYRNYYESEDSMIEDIVKQKKLESYAKENSYKYIEVQIEKNFKKNVDTVKSLMLYFKHSQ